MVLLFQLGLLIEKRIHSQTHPNVKLFNNFVKMKTFTLKAGGILCLFLLVAFSTTVKSQTVTIYAADYGTPAWANGDEYEMGFLVVHYTGSTPDQTWDSPNAPTALVTGGVFPFPFYTTFIVNNFTYSDTQAHYKVLVSIKRRVNGTVVCGGQKLSAFMTPYDLLNTPFTVATVNLY